ncbi:hypothetical protein N7520_008138 [Penicillium odoratum]|uniref:uncharacterized protein n=1 Tax=Penicillium odoratum TaxID=1167516 RepID=UPI002547B2CD|nr:uncharacterized protein N7520_008138 [Penicillium odoratum]KAJ5760982.1 hypothetical protein N7520_008138 [Penicillium odoratum]
MPNQSSQFGKRKKQGQWAQTRKGTDIEAGDVGIFVTCDIGRESKCVAEITDILSQIVENDAKPENDKDSDEDDADIEAQIRRELEGLQPSKKKTRPVQAMQLDIPCVVFARFNDKSVDPVKIVHQLCLDAQANTDTKKSRYIKRLTPITMIKKTLSVDLEVFAREVLKPHFHSGGGPKKYAIRPTCRGNHKLNRDIIIKTVADVVGPEHPVNLKDYDLMILVDVVQNVIGMSVVGSNYDQLKRFNIAEIYDPSPKGEETPAQNKEAKV